MNNMSTRRPLTWLGLLVLASVLSACSLFESEGRFDPVKLTSYEQTAQGHTVWSQSIGSRGGYGFAPMILGDDVVAATPSGDVARLSLLDGSTRWRVDVQTTLSAGVGSDGQTVAVTSRDGRVIALDATTGEVRWHGNTSTVSSTPPVIASGKVVTRNDDFRIQAFDVQTGELQWGYMRSSAPLALRTSTRMIATPSAVLVPVPAGRIVALDIHTGRLIWDYKVGSAVGATDLDTVVDVVGMPVMADGAICSISYQSMIHCFYATDSVENEPQLKWAQRFSSAVGLGADGGRLFAAGMFGEVTAFNAADGQLLWQDSTLRNRGLTNPVSFDDLLYVGDYQGYVHFYDVASGELRGRMSVGDSRSIQSPLTATPYGVLVQTGSGRLVMLRAQ